MQTQYTSGSHKGMNGGMNQSLIDRMQLHMQQNQMDEFGGDAFKDSMQSSHRSDKLNSQSPNNNSGMCS